MPAVRRIWSLALARLRGVLRQTTLIKRLRAAYLRRSAQDRAAARYSAPRGSDASVAAKAANVSMNATGRRAFTMWPAGCQDDRPSAPVCRG